QMDVPHGGDADHVSSSAWSGEEASATTRSQCTSSPVSSSRTVRSTSSRHGAEGTVPVTSTAPPRTSTRTPSSPGSPAASRSWRWATRYSGLCSGGTPPAEAVPWLLMGAPLLGPSDGRTCARRPSSAAPSRPGAPDDVQPLQQVEEGGRHGLVAAVAAHPLPVDLLPQRAGDGQHRAEVAVVFGERGH